MTKKRSRSGPQGSVISLEAVDLTGGTRALFDRDPDVSSASVVGLREHKTTASSLAEWLGIGPDTNGRIQGIRDALLVPRGSEVQVFAAIKPSDNPKQFSRREAKKGIPQARAIGRLSKRDGHGLATELHGREALVALYVDATPGMEHLEIRWKPAHLDDNDGAALDNPGEGRVGQGAAGAEIASTETLQPTQPEDRRTDDRAVAEPSQPVASTTAGWHPDPSGRHEYRYWDGTVWTAHVSDAGVTGSDPPT